MPLLYKFYCLHCSRLLIFGVRCHFASLPNNHQLNNFSRREAISLF
uniref:Uncharacterized protein n=1 Tax=Arundo donax TaxID=35708 RepID=A0A0A8YTQ5_ARUDO